MKLARGRARDGLVAPRDLRQSRCARLRTRLPHRLVEMRLAAVRRGHNMVKRDRDSVGLITQKAREFRGYAVSYRGQAADTRTETALRATIAKQFPQLHNRAMRSDELWLVGFRFRTASGTLTRHYYVVPRAADGEQAKQLAGRRARSAGERLKRAFAGVDECWIEVRRLRRSAIGAWRLSEGT